MNTMHDTITAIATPIGVGGIAVLRVSGEDSLEITQKITTLNLRECESHKLTFTQIHRPNDPNDVIDEALIAVMSASSFTGELTVEISCHGGYMAANAILSALIDCGARLAELGEFTRRAFINGKIDLTRAEAIADIIHATSELGFKAASSNVQGKLFERINSIRNDTLFLASHIAAIADFPEEIDDIDDLDFISSVKNIQISIKSLQDSFKTGKMLREGIGTVIAGKPNVGKSSLLNALLREDRAIVTATAGTTRDTIEEFVNLRGISLRLIDTAGIRQSADVIEKLGIERSVSNIESADLVLLVIDISNEISSEDLEIAELCGEKNVIVIANKSDLPGKYSVDELRNLLNLPNVEVVQTSTPQSGEVTGIAELESAIAEKFKLGEISTDNVYITRERHRESLLRASEAVERILAGVEAGIPRDLLSVDLEDALTSLGEIVGLTVQEEIIDQVFANFCVGK